MLPRALSVVTVVLLLMQSSSSQPASKIYATRHYAATNNLYACYLDGSGGVSMTLSANPRYVAVDWTSVPHKLYVGLRPDSGGAKIIRCNTDGTGEEDVVTDLVGISDLELDLVRRKVFWLQDTWDDDRISHADMDGLNSNVTQIYATTVANRILWGLALDPEHERLWITERGSTCYDSYIRKMRYSGGGVKTVAFPVCNPHDIEYINGRIVWGERVGIVSADSGGSSIDTLVVDAAVYGLAVDGTWGRIYWADYTTDDIRRVDLDGGNEMTVVGGLGEFQCLATDYSPAVVSAEPQPAWPIAYGLLQNYPNPFNPSTTITWDLPERVDVDLSVFNALGQRVATLVDAPMEAGRHSAEFHASGLAGGVYVYRLRAGAFTQSCRMVLIR